MILDGRLFRQRFWHPLQAIELPRARGVAYGHHEIGI